MCVYESHMAKENWSYVFAFYSQDAPAPLKRLQGFASLALRSGSDVRKYTLAQSSCSSLSPRCWMMLRSGLSASLSSSSTQKNHLFVSAGTVMLKQKRGLEETVTTMVEARCCLTHLSQAITGCGLQVWTRGVKFYSLKSWKCTVLQESQKATLSVISSKKTTVRWWKCQHANICMMSSTLALPHRYFEPCMATLCKASFL